MATATTRPAGGFTRRRREAEDPNNTWNAQLFAALLSSNFAEAAALVEKGATVNHTTANVISANSGAAGAGGGAGGGAEGGSGGGGGAAGHGQQQPQAGATTATAGSANDKQSQQALLALQQHQRVLHNFLRAGGAVPLCVAIVFRASGVAGFGEASPGSPATIAIADAVEALVWLAENGANLNATVDAAAGVHAGGTMLHMCVHFDWPDSLDRLLRLRAARLRDAAVLSAAVCDSAGMTPTMLAIASQKLELARCLLRHGAPYEFAARADHEHTPLGRACVTNDAALAELLLQLGDDADQLCSETGRTLLQLAWSAFDRQGADAGGAGLHHHHSLPAASVRGGAGAGGAGGQGGGQGGGAANANNMSMKGGEVPVMQLLPVLLNRGHDINRPAAGGKTAVSYAMDKLPRALTQSHLDHFLTAAGGNVDAADATTGRTLLMTAVDNCDIDLMRRLVLEFRADVNAADCFGATALHRACASGRRIGLVEQLLAFETIKINALDGEGQTPLHRAAIRGREAVVKLLIGKDTCDVNAADVLGNTALHHAVIEGHAGLVDLIVGLNTNPRPVSADKKRGGGGGGASGPGLAASASKRDKNAADGSLTRVVIDAENAAGLTPLECAVASAVAAAAAAKSRPDDDAAADANLAIVAKLLLGSASVRRIAATSKLSLLQLAVTARSLDLVAAFIGKQADVHHRCAADRTALHYAVELREMAIVAELIASGAQVDAQESVALRAPIHIACAHLDTEMVALLLANGASVNVVDNDFRTPLQLCCDRASSSSSSSPTLVPGALDRATTIGRALLAAGAQPVVRDRWKRTPLHYACAADAVELVRDLLCVPGGIPVWQTDATLATPLHTAAMHGAVRVVDLLCGLIETRHAAGNDQVRTSREIVCALEAALAAGKALVAAGASRAVKAGAENARPTDPLVAMRRAQLALDLEGAAATAARHILAAEDANSEAAQWRDGIRQRDGMGRTPTLIAAEAGCAQVAKRIAAALRVLAGKT